MNNDDLEKAKIDYRLKLNIAAAIKNSVSLICFTVLAIVFDKWWLVLLTTLFLCSVEKDKDKDN